MKKKMLLVVMLATLLTACTGATPTPTPDEHAILKAYLEEAKALIDKKREASDALAKQVDLPGIDDRSIEGRRAWQEVAVRQRPLLLEIQSQWEALNPPPMAQGYHSQMALIIEKELERWLKIEMAPIGGSGDTFYELFADMADELLWEIQLIAEAATKFETLWEIATEGQE